MKSLVWFVLGVAGGFVVAHFMNKDPRGHEVLAAVDARIAEFTDRIGDAYRQEEARLASAAPAEQASDFASAGTAPEASDLASAAPATEASDPLA